MYHWTAAEIETATIQKCAQFFERLSPELDAVYVAVRHLRSPRVQRGNPSSPVSATVRAAA
jgi:hypothetical protein